MATHNEEELRAAARALAGAARATGLDPRARVAAPVQRVTGEVAGRGPDRPDVRRLPDAEPQRAGVFDFEADDPVRRAA